MSSSIIERLTMELGIDATKFKGQAKQAIDTNEKLEKSLIGAEEASDNVSKSLNDMGEKTDKAKGKTESFGKVVTGAAKTIGAFYAAVKSSQAFKEFIVGVTKANEQLLFLEKRLNTSARNIKTFSNAAAMLGGSADGMQSTMKGLNQSIQEMVMFGDSSMIPFFSALGVGVTDANGKMRDMSEIILDMSDSFSKLETQQAYALAQSMGLDEGTANALIQGRDAMQEMLDMQKTLYVSTEAELKASRELSKQQSFLSAQWDGVKTMIGNMLIPIITKMVKVVSDFLGMLQRNEKRAKNFFQGLAIVIGLVLIPILTKAALAFASFVAPIAGSVAIVAALGAAFIALYDDYQVWAEGGRSAFDWGWFQQQFIGTKDKTSNLSKAFLNLIGDYKSWAEVGDSFFNWLKLKGFIDDNEISVKSLGTGFKNLANDIKNYLMPAFGWLGEAMDKLMSGDFSGVWDMVKELDAKSAKWLEKKGQDFMSGWRGEATFDQMWRERQGAVGGSGSMKAGTLSDDKRQSIARVAKNIGVSPNDLAAIISFETAGSFSPKSKNPHSSATGLIQFMQGSGGTKGKYYGMSRDEFAGLSFDKQMNYVERYFKERGFRADKPQDVASAYTAVTGYGYKRGSKAYELNKVWDSNKDGYIAKGEMVQNPAFQAHRRDYFGGGIGGARGMVSNASSVVAGGSKTVASSSKSIEVNVSGVTVNTSASTVGGATSEGVGAAIGRSGFLNQLASGVM